MKVKIFMCKSCKKIMGQILQSTCPTFCCGNQMIELHPGVSDAPSEKHVPIITTHNGIVEVTVGDKLHQMHNDHYIAWIGLETNEGLHIKKLSPHQEPKALFAVVDGNYVHKAYAYCTIHGLWTSI